MKKRNFYILVSMLVAVSILPITAFPSEADYDNRGNIKLTYRFEEPEIEKSGEYHRVEVPGLRTAKEIGKPKMPFTTARILLPYGKTYDEINIHYSSMINIKGEYFIEPGQSHYIEDRDKEVLPDPTIYSSSSNYPGKDFRVVTVQNKRGYRILYVNIYPVQYIPGKSKLSYCHQVEVEVSTKSAKIEEGYRGVPKDSALITRSIDNPEVLSSYPIKLSSSKRGEILGGRESEPAWPPQLESTAVEHVIITNNELKNAQGTYNFQALETHREANGLNSTIVTIEQITSYYSGDRPDGGNDRQTKIRNFIKDIYEKWNTDYILIGGDELIIPPRYFYAWQANGYPPPNPRGSHYYPADLYYSCLYSAGLDSDFDYNQNGRYGEVSDGPGGGEVDLLSEVWVGRVPVKNSQDLSNSVKKIIDYGDSSNIYLHKLLFTALAGLGRDTRDDLMWGTSGTNGFHLQPFFNDAEFMCDSESHNWTAQDVLDQINDENDANHMIFDITHGGVNGGMLLHTRAESDSYNLGDLTNTRPFLIYLDDCHVGSFDYIVGLGKIKYSGNTSSFTIGSFNPGGDSLPDICFSVQYGNQLKIAYGDGQGGLTNTTIIADYNDGLDQPTRVIKGHLNSDAYWDFVVINSNDHSFLVVLSDGSGGYSTTLYSDLPENPVHLTAGDFDDDGDPDLAIISSSDIYTYRNVGSHSGTYSKYSGIQIPPGSIGGNLNWIDCNAFGSGNDVDLIVTSDNDNIYHIIGNGNGTFSQVTSYYTQAGWLPKAVCSGDFNQDGYNDIAVACRAGYWNDNEPALGYYGEVWIYFNDVLSPGTFLGPQVVPTGINGVDCISTLDLNLDGNLDLLVSSIAGGPSVCLGVNNGKFIHNRAGYGELQYGACISAGDFDADGCSDIVVSKSSGIYIGLSTQRDCFCEELLNIEHAASASVGAASYGARVDYTNEFVDAISREGKDYLGEVFADSKEDNIGQFYGQLETAWRPGYYYVNLFGDPATKLKMNRIPFVMDNGDFNGDGASEVGIFRNNSGLWAIKGTTRVYYGNRKDLPVNGDYDGDQVADIAIFRKTAGLWSVRGITRVYYGGSSDMPMPGDYNGDGLTDIAVYRPSDTRWAIRGISSFYYGNHMDIPTVLDYNGDGADDPALFRGSSGLWAVRDLTRVYFGTEGDLPIPADYDGDGRDEITIFRPSSNLWAVKDVTRCYFGDVNTYYGMPVPADYDGNNQEDVSIFRPTTSLWAVRDVTRLYFGSYVDFPIFGSSTKRTVATWHMDEAYWNGTNDEVEDSSANDNHGTAKNGATTTASGIIGRAGLFDGSNDHVEIPNSVSLQLDGDLTLSFWLNPNNIGSGRLNPLDKSYGGEFALTIETNGRLSYYHGTNRQSGYYWGWTPFDSGTLVNGKWQFVTITRDSSSNTMRSYLDGALVKTTTYSTDPNKIPSTSSYPVKIARGYTGVGYGGAIDEVRICPRALSEDEIWKDYEEGTLVSCYKLDENEGTSVQDSSVHSNDGTIYGADWTNGVLGSALDFDGVNDYLIIPDSPSNGDFSSQITLEAWINPDSYPGGGGDGSSCIVTKSSAYYFNLNTTGHLRFYWYNLSPPGYHTSPNVIPTGVWTHVVATYDGSYVRVYENGVLVKTVSVTGNGRTISSPVGIGRFPGSAIRHFNGQIDEVKIYSRALSGDEILEHYEEGTP